MTPNLSQHYRDLYDHEPNLSKNKPDVSKARGVLREVGLIVKRFNVMLGHNQKHKKEHNEKVATHEITTMKSKIKPHLSQHDTDLSQHDPTCPNMTQTCPNITLSYHSKTLTCPCHIGY